MSADSLPAMLLRAYEIVHHDADCPSIGGNGDGDCKCDAVPFIRDLKAALEARPGCVVVPADPTAATLVAAANSEPDGKSTRAERIYRAMLSAAPKASDTEVSDAFYATPPADPALPTDDELPGMWSRADLIGGETDSPPHVEITTFNNGVCEVTAYTLEDGKYEIRSADNGAVVAFRYGEEWRDLTGDKLIGALLAVIPKPKDKS